MKETRFTEAQKVFVLKQGEDPEMLAANHAPEPREEALGQIGVRAIAAVGLGMVDPAHVKVGIEQVPMSNLVGGDDASGRDPLLREVHALGLPKEGPRQCLAAALAQDDHHAALAAAIGQTPPANPLLAQVGWSDVTSERCPIDLNLDRLQRESSCRCREQEMLSQDLLAA